MLVLGSSVNSILTWSSPQIYVGSSEADASALAAETFHVKAPLEEALEKADTPVTPPAGSESEPDYKTAPVEWVQYKFQEFVNIAVLDPVAAFKALPYTGGAVGVVFATLIGLLGVCTSKSLSNPPLSTH